MENGCFIGAVNYTKLWSRTCLTCEQEVSGWMLHNILAKSNVCLTEYFIAGVFGNKLTN